MEYIAHKGQNSELCLPMGTYPGHYSNHKLKLQPRLYYINSVSATLCFEFRHNNFIDYTMHVPCYLIYNAARVMIIILVGSQVGCTVSCAQKSITIISVANIRYQQIYR